MSSLRLVLTSRIWSGVLVQTRGYFRSFQPVMHWRILIIRSRTGVKVLQ